MLGSVDKSSDSDREADSQDDVDLDTVDAKPPHDDSEPPIAEKGEVTSAVERSETVATEETPEYQDPAVPEASTAPARGNDASRSPAAVPEASPSPALADNAAGSPTPPAEHRTPVTGDFAPDEVPVSNVTQVTSAPGSPAAAASEPLVTQEEQLVMAKPNSSSAPKERVVIDIVSSDEEADAKEDGPDADDQGEEDVSAGARVGAIPAQGEDVEEQDEYDEEEEEEDFVPPPARQTPRSTEMLDLTGSDDSEEEDGDAKAAGATLKTVFMPFDDSAIGGAKNDNAASADAAGDDRSMASERDDGSDDSYDSDSDSEANSESSSSSPSSRGDSSGTRGSTGSPDPIEGIQNRSPSPLAEATRVDIVAEEEDELDEDDATSSPVAPPVYHVPDSDGEEVGAAEDVDMDAPTAEDVAAGVTEPTVSGIEITPLDDITASALNVLNPVRPDLVETPGIERPAPFSFGSVQVEETIIEIEDVTAPITPSDLVPEEASYYHHPAESPATLAETPRTNTIDLGPTDGPATDMTDQPDAEIVHHAAHVDDTLQQPASERPPASISIPSAEEEEAQVEATSGMEVEDVAARSEAKVPTAMVDQPDAEIIHHAAHVDDVLHAPATGTGNALLSMPTDEEEEEQLLANAGEDNHAQPEVAHVSPDAEQGDMEVVDVAPAMTVEDLPDPMVTPPATDLEAPIEAGDLPTRSRSPSMEVEPPANPPAITISSRPPSREDSPVHMPDPQAPPPDAHIPSPLQVGDMPLRDDPSPSVIVQAPEEDPILSTPVDVVFRASTSPSPSPELPDPKEPAADAWLPMPDVPVSDKPSSPSIVVQAPEEAEQAGGPANAEAEGLNLPAADDSDEAQESGMAPRETRDDAAGVDDADTPHVAIEAEPEVHIVEPIAREPVEDTTLTRGGLLVPEDEAPIETPASEREVDFGLNTRETTPHAPLRHHHGAATGAGPSPRRARRSMTPAGDPPTTRSHCDYHKIRLSSASQTGTFLVPQCVLGDAERIAAEDLEDLGKASKEEEKAGKKNVVSHGRKDIGKELATKLHRISGAGVFDEGHLYLLSVEQLELEVDDEADIAEEGDNAIEAEAAVDTDEGAGEADLPEEQEGDDDPEVEVDIQATPAGNTRSKTDSVEPGLDMGGPSEIRSRESSRALSVASTHGDEPDVEHRTLRRSSRLSTSIEPSSENLPHTTTRSGRHRRTRSSGLAEDTSAGPSGSAPMGRTASVTSQATIPEDPAESQATVRPRRSTRHKTVEPKPEPVQEESAGNAGDVKDQAAAEEAQMSGPRTPARAKAQPKTGTSARRVSKLTRQDEAGYRPGTPELERGRGRCRDRNAVAYDKSQQQ